MRNEWVDLPEVEPVPQSRSVAGRCFLSHALISKAELVRMTASPCRQDRIIAAISQFIPSVCADDLRSVPTCHRMKFIVYAPCSRVDCSAIRYLGACSNSGGSDRDRFLKQIGPSKRMEKPSRLRLREEGGEISHAAPTARLVPLGPERKNAQKGPRVPKLIGGVANHGATH